MRKIAMTAVAVLAVLAIAAPPAFAAASVSFRSGTPTAGSEISGTWTITADASTPTGDYLQSFSLHIRIDPAESNVPSMGSNSGVGRTWNNFETQSATLSLSWNTRDLTPYNGTYNILAFADSHFGDQVSRAIDPVHVNNPPNAPSGVTATLDDDDNPVVKWSANPEPDITGYRISRSVDNGSYTQIATVSKSALSYKDSAQLPKGEPIRYQIVAVRRSPVSASGIASSATRSSAVTKPLPPSPSPQDDPTPGSQPQTPGQQTDGVPGTGPAANTAITGPSLQNGDSAPGLGPPPSAGPPPRVTIGTRTLPRRDLDDFAATLPYGAEPPEQFIEAETPVGRTLAAPINFVAQRVQSPKFLAASMIMLVMALHLIRLSRRLLSPV